MHAGIIGYGFVGQAVHAIMRNDVLVSIYDINKKKYKNNKERLLDTKILFICVPTPADDNYDVYIKETLDWLCECNYQGIVVIKSTIIHTYIKNYEQDLKLCYNPEFLNQNTSILDSFSQECVILGGEISVTKKVQDFYHDFTQIDPSYEFMSIKEASQFKYTRNLYGAYKVLFWEFIQDTTGNARKMAELYSKMEYQSEMSQVGMDGFRGFGGACFPKDTSIWDKEHQHELTNFMLNYNNKLKN